MMKKIIFTLITLLLMNSCSVDDKYAYETNCDNFFKGNHKLLSLNNMVNKESIETSSAAFFIIVGSYSSEKRTIVENYVIFSWLNNKDVYMVTKLPISNVRFRIDSTILDPYCKFRWKYPGNFGIRSFTESDWKLFFIYALFVIKPEHIYNANVKLDLGIIQ